MATKQAKTSKQAKTRHHWLFWHQWIGIIACLGMVLWGLSGASHPLMGRLQPVPRQFTPPLVPVDLSQAIPLPAVLAQHAILQFQHISLVQLAGQAYYRVALPEASARFFALTDGLERAAAEPALAVSLARYYTGLPEQQVLSVQAVTRFDDDYHAVNRLLPVWRVSFAQEGGLRAYIDTGQSRLATLVDDRRALLTQVFQLGHNWSFLQACSRLQLAVASAVLALILASAVTGLVLYVRQRHTAPYRLRRWGLQWWHREAGLWVSVMLALLASSGLFHLWLSDIQQRRPVLETVFASDSSAISAEAWARIANDKVLKLDIYGRAKQVLWQVIPAHAGGEAIPAASVAAMHQHHAAVSAAPVAPQLWLSQQGKVEPLLPGAYAATWLGILQPGQSTETWAVHWVTTFANEYGFVFKRLPVLKVATDGAGHRRLYLEPATGALAASINDTDGLEGLVFAYLHKWSVPGISKDIRDLLAILAALSVASLGGLGATLFYLNRRWPTRRGQARGLSRK